MRELPLNIISKIIENSRLPLVKNIAYIIHLFLHTFNLYTRNLLLNYIKIQLYFRRKKSIIMDAIIHSRVEIYEDLMRVYFNIIQVLFKYSKCATISISARFEDSKRIELNPYQILVTHIHIHILLHMRRLALLFVKQQKFQFKHS